MCFNAALVQSAEIIEELYGVPFPAERFDLPAFFRSAFDHPSWPVLKQNPDEGFVPAFWGLIPSWTRSAEDARSIRDKTINARFETLDSRPSYRGLVDRKRCGVLMDGFVEWRSFNGMKYPYHIAMPEKRPFLAAGLWDTWKDPASDSGLETFTVVTVEAAGLPAQIHNTKLRMPLILGRDFGRRWLDGTLAFSEIVPTLAPYYHGLDAWPVSREVSARGGDKNRKEIQTRTEYPELPPLELLEQAGSRHYSLES
jgi:putative SOS response-associated peptidase YedK